MVDEGIGDAVWEGAERADSGQSQLHTTMTCAGARESAEAAVDGELDFKARMVRAITLSVDCAQRARAMRALANTMA